MQLRTRRLIGLLPLIVAVGYSAFSLGSGCLAWEYEVASNASETSIEGDSENDTGFVPDGPFILPDGRECTGHDEDRDGVPDECDNCPNVFNPDQSGSSVGTACGPTSAFIPSPARLLFDPFRSSSSWKGYGTGTGVFELAADGDAVVGGNSSLSVCEMLEAGVGRCPLYFLGGSTGAGTSALVVTTTIKVLEENNGSAGLLFRLNGMDTAKKGYLCAVSVVNGFAIARIPDTGCNGGYCAPITFTMPTDAGTTAAQVAIPNDIPHGLGDTIGLRASVTASMGDGGILGDIECRVFDPLRPETLASSDPKYALKITAGGTRWFPSGEVGVYAQRSRASFGSVDVLRGP